MTEPSERTPDPEAAEEFAEQVGVDPTQDEIEHYLQLEGEPPETGPAGTADVP